ncbi:hypothetical protein BDV23DRAFT_178392 [Aspergillus alliaceus]|uniref:Uncharacterized protein n=1 Tax=Petromyces alliaceus TaxID=209559 RepID=A0A5N7CNJ0_PETAA|nr:hypothetical protein BDV23DRAFT_178392 [Aspergillus alliaceus]
MTYGSLSEWRQSQQHIIRNQWTPSTIILRKFGPTIIAVVYPNKAFENTSSLPQGLKRSEVIFPEFTDIQVPICVPKVSGPTAELKFRRFTVLKYLKNIAPEDIQINLYGEHLGELFKKESDDAAITYSGSVQFSLNAASVQMTDNCPSEASIK